MAQTSASKTDFIKFNVSPVFKKRVESKAQKQGYTLSELGRMLFGAYETGLIERPPVDINTLAKQAQEDERLGRVKTFTNNKELTAYLKSLSQ